MPLPRSMAGTFASAKLPALLRIRTLSSDSEHAFTLFAISDSILSLCAIIFLRAAGAREIVNFYGRIRLQPEDKNIHGLIVARNGSERAGDKGLGKPVKPARCPLRCPAA